MTIFHASALKSCYYRGGVNIRFASTALMLGNNYTTLLIIRLIMMGIGVIYTPQAAGTAALIVPAEKRGSTIAYIFLGWSLAAAIGLPLIAFVANRYGWQVAYIGIGAGGIVSFVSPGICPANSTRRPSRFAPGSISAAIA
jgi:predicted MFS family arabinose efflux permease